MACFVRGEAGEEGQNSGSPVGGVIIKSEESEKKEIRTNIGLETQDKD